MAYTTDPGLDPAFPPPAGGGNKQGVTVRDYLAAYALSGLCVNMGRAPDAPSIQLIADEAYRLADAALEARKRK